MAAEPYGGYAFKRAKTINPFLSRVAKALEEQRIPTEEFTMQNLLKVNHAYVDECAKYQNDLFALVMPNILKKIMPGQELVERIESSGYCDNHYEGAFRRAPIRELTAKEYKRLIDETQNFFNDCEPDCPITNCGQKLNVSKDIFFFVHPELDKIKKNEYGIISASARIKQKSIKLAVNLTGFQKEQGKDMMDSELYYQLTDPLGLRFIIEDKKTARKSMVACRTLQEKIKEVIDETPIKGSTLAIKDYLNTPGKTGYQTLTSIFKIRNYAWEVQIRTEKLDLLTKMDPNIKDAHYKTESIREHLKFIEIEKKRFKNKKQGVEFVEFRKESWPWLIYAFFVAFNQEGKAYFDNLFIADNHLAKTLKVMQEEGFDHTPVLKGIRDSKTYLGISSHSKLLKPLL